MSLSRLIKNKKELKELEKHKNKIIKLLKERIKGFNLTKVIEDIIGLLMIKGWKNESMVYLFLNNADKVVDVKIIDNQIESYESVENNFKDIIRLFLDSPTDRCVIVHTHVDGVESIRPNKFDLKALFSNMLLARISGVSIVDFVVVNNSSSVMFYSMMFGNKFNVIKELDDVFKSVDETMDKKINKLFEAVRNEKKFIRFDVKSVRKKNIKDLKLLRMKELTKRKDK